MATFEELRQLLCRQRGIGAEAEKHFFHPFYEDVIHDPQALYGMSEAVERIYGAVRKGEHIVVYGDYDADGITSTAQLIATLRDIGGQAVPYLPHRLDEGYGLNLSVLKNLAKEADLIITVDCGVANVEEIAWLKQEGVDAIVVDHHEIGAELPPALAILHPRHPQGAYPWGYLSGAGVTWKLCQALLRDERSHHAHDRDKEKWLLDLTVLGTVADVVPIQNENRAITRFGLEVLRRSRRPGIRALLSGLRLSGADLSLEDVSFRIVPRINAPGRIEHPQPALDLLLAGDAVSAAILAQSLEDYNLKRQTLARRVTKEAEAQMVVGAPLVFAFDAAWPAGVVGLAAGQLARKFGRPAVIVGGNGRHGVGSARSPIGFNILNILEAGREHLLKLGGHAQAAGFSVVEDNISRLYAALVKATKSDAAFDTPIEESQAADAVIEPSLLNWKTAEALVLFEPFGERNHEPKLVIKRLPLLGAQTVGKKQDHAKFTFDTPTAIDAIGFGLGGAIDKLGDYVDVLGSLRINRFRGSTRLQLHVLDIAKAGTVQITEKVEEPVKS